MQESELWDPAVGLWWSAGPGHTISTKSLVRLHPAPNAACRLLAAAQMETLPEIDVTKVLTTLRSMQVRNGSEKHGCLKWYWEEDQVQDTNAAFFSGLNLIVLQWLWHEKLPSGSRDILRNIFKDLYVWFMRVSQGKKFYYPNQCLGDLVCAWLLSELLEVKEQRDALLALLKEAGQYLLEERWGWGEHMSDNYAHVCLDEISLLLLLSRELPDDVKELYKKLLADLLLIDDLFDGGPRVPALRSYAFTHGPRSVAYRTQIRPWKSGEHPAISNLLLLHPLLFKLGWHQLAPPQFPPRKDISVQLFGKATATARLEPDVRLGSASRFPLMPTKEPKMSWQCFPVALWRAEGDWGFLQWQSLENDKLCAHPASVKDGYTAHMLKALSSLLSPSPFGRTYAIQKGPYALVLRVMPAISSGWEELVDRFRMLEFHGEIKTVTTDGAWHQILLNYPQRTISVQFIGLSHAIIPQLQNRGAQSFDWQARYPASDLKGRRLAASLWGISLGGAVTESPRFNLLQPCHHPCANEGQIRELIWRWPGISWHVEIDPLGNEGLKDISAT